MKSTLTSMKEKQPQPHALQYPQCSLLAILLLTLSPYTQTSGSGISQWCFMQSLLLFVPPVFPYFTYNYANTLLISILIPFIIDFFFLHYIHLWEEEDFCLSGKQQAFFCSYFKLAGSSNLQCIYSMESLTFNFVQVSLAE